MSSSKNGNGEKGTVIRDIAPQSQGTLNVEGLGPLCELYHGEKGKFAYQAFVWLNARVFDGALPVPLFQWALTDFGGCVGSTMSRARDIVKPPVIDLHPAIWEYSDYVGKNKYGWAANIPYGPRYTLDVVLHELIHVEVNYLRGGRGLKAHSSHDNEVWCEAIMRAALHLKGTILEMPPFKAQPTKRYREDGHQVRRTPDGSIPMCEISHWPHSMRAPDYYGAQRTARLIGNCLS